MVCHSYFIYRVSEYVRPLNTIVAVNANESCVSVAFLGTVFDSMLGSLLQVKYRCLECSKILEKEEHCGLKCDKYSGFAFFDNDVVNFVSGLFTAVAAALLSLMLI